LSKSVFELSIELCSDYPRLLSCGVYRTDTLGLLLGHGGHGAGVANVLGAVGRKKIGWSVYHVATARMHHDDYQALSDSKTTLPAAS